MKSQVQKKVICKQRDLRTGEMAYFVVNEGKGRRRGCWISSADIDLSALILERSIRIDEKIERCKSRGRRPEKSSSLSESSQAPRDRSLNKTPLSAQLAVAKARSEMEKTLLQHEIEAGKLLLRYSIGNGNGNVPATEMSNIRLVSIRRLETIFLELEKFGHPSRDRSYIVSMLSKTEEGAISDFRRLKSAQNSSVAAAWSAVWNGGPSPPELGVQGVSHEQVLQANRTSPLFVSSTEGIVRTQHLSATDLQNQGMPQVDAVSSVQMEPSGEAVMGTNLAGFQLASMGCQFQPSFSGYPSANVSSRPAHPLGSQTGASRGPSPSLMANPIMYGQLLLPNVASNSEMASVMASYAQQQQLSYPYLLQQAQAALQHQQLCANGGMTGPNTTQETTRVPPGYTMQDFEPRPMEEMQQQPREACSSQNSNGENHLP